MANSYNEIFGLGSHSADASLEGWWPCQDSASNQVVEDLSGNNQDGVVGHSQTTAQYSTTGPNSWLTKGFLARANRYVELPDFTLSTPRTLLCRGYMGSVFIGVGFFLGSSGGSGRNYIGANGNTNTPYFRYGDNSEFGTVTGVITDNAWFNYASTLNSSLGVVGYVDGSSIDTATLTNAPSTTANINLQSYNDGQAAFIYGKFADAAILSRVLSSSEVVQWNDGPEPVNTVAPTLSGTETEGQTLTTTSGTWGLDSPFASGSNGTITYSYQWYRADDVSGTNRAAIAGETATTYTLTSSDVGKYVQAQVRATNTGGFDSDADTASAYTGAISSTAGGFAPYFALRATTVGI